MVNKAAQFRTQNSGNSGKLHKDADCLSRNPVSPPPETNQDDLFDPLLLLIQPDALVQEQLVEAIRNEENDQIPIGTRKRA